MGDFRRENIHFYEFYIESWLVHIASNTLLAVPFVKTARGFIFSFN